MCHRMRRTRKNQESEARAGFSAALCHKDVSFPWESRGLSEEIRKGGETSGVKVRFSVHPRSMFTSNPGVFVSFSFNKNFLSSYYVPDTTGL